MALPVTVMATEILDIAGLSLPLSQAAKALARLDAVYAELDRRLADYAAKPANTVLCRAGCSHCCRSGGFFAVTLVEALRLNRAAALLPAHQRDAAQSSARAMIERQRAVFAEVPGPADEPGNRDETVFSARVSAVTRTAPACPLLHQELCSIYPGRPFLCRAYGYAVDAYAVESPHATVFRSLCVLYEGVPLRDYVRAKELRAELSLISRDLAGGRDVGRFTLPEAILAREGSTRSTD